MTYRVHLLGQFELSVQQIACQTISYVFIGEQDHSLTSTILNTGLQIQQMNFFKYRIINEQECF